MGWRDRLWMEFYVWRLKSVMALIRDIENKQRLIALKQESLEVSRKDAIGWMNHYSLRVKRYLDKEKAHAESSK